MCYAWDPTRWAYLVSSARNGTVSVLRQDGSTRTLINDPRMVSPFGLVVDTARNRLLVAHGDLGVGTRSRPETARRRSGLGIYDLITGAPIRLVSLEYGTEPRAATDVAVDRHGIAYVTDRLGDTIYRVDRHGRVIGRVGRPDRSAPNGRLRTG